MDNIFQDAREGMDLSVCTKEKKNQAKDYLEALVLLPQDEESKLFKTYKDLFNHMNISFSGYYQKITSKNAKNHNTGIKTTINGKQYGWSVRKSSQKYKYKSASKRTYYQATLEAIAKAQKDEYVNIQQYIGTGDLGVDAHTKGIYIGKTQKGIGVAFYALSAKPEIKKYWFSDYCQLISNRKDVFILDPAAYPSNSPILPNYLTVVLKNKEGTPSLRI